jgi:HSP20 family protein
MVSRMFYGRDPFHDLRRLHGDITRVLGAPTQAAEYPALNVYANQDGVVITAELPGVNPDDLDISVHRETVSIKGKRDDRAADARGYHRQERRQGNFLRTISLPFLVDTAKVKAEMTDGVLALALQRAEEDKPKRVSVSSRKGGKSLAASKKSAAAAKKPAAASSKSDKKSGKRAKK